MTALQLLEDLEQTLLQISALLPDDPFQWENDEILRFAVERLWIYAGTTAEAFRVSKNLARDVQPWSELYAFRNVLAHWTPSQANPARVWHESSSDIARLLHEVAAARE